ncbi:MAG TPA: ABC transporter ATP-binding protein [Ktedonobacterales bacterium]|nr:ABC transporter ATP-binding protein [Ktedonobacterales bacterium]
MSMSSSSPQERAEERDKLPEGAATEPTETTAQVTERTAEKVAEKAIIVAEGLSRHFMQAGEVIKAVDEVSFKIASRQLVAITGPSGCGKTTLMYLLGGLERPTSGTLLIDGIDVPAIKGREEDAFRRAKVGFIFQSFNLIPDLSALENVMLPMEIVGKGSENHHARARRLLLRVGLDEKRHLHRPGKLSGGQQQRVAIARALANNPAVILADEPTGNLDSKTGRNIVELLSQLSHQGRTVIVVTHDRSIARLADKRMELEDGRIISIKQNSNRAKPNAATMISAARK